MRRALIVIVVGVAALALGAAVAGRPQDVASDVVSSRLPKAVTTATTTIVVATTERPTPTTGALAPAPTSTSTATATTVSITSTTALEPMSAVRIVVANATNISGLAARTIESLRPLGYTDLVATDAIEDRAQTIIVHVDGRSGEARRLAAQIGLDPERVQPRQVEEVLTVNAEDGDVWLLIGADRM